MFIVSEASDTSRPRKGKLQHTDLSHKGIMVLACQHVEFQECVLQGLVQYTSSSPHLSRTENIENLQMHVSFDATNTVALDSAVQVPWLGISESQTEPSSAAVPGKRVRKNEFTASL